MSLINIDNSTTTYGTVMSFRLVSKSHGIRYIDGPMTSNEIRGTVLDLALGWAPATGVREVAGVIYSMIDVERELYSLQRIMNLPEWKATGITATAEFRIVSTDHGEISGQAVLLVKTTWQEQQQEEEVNIDQI